MQSLRFFVQVVGLKSHFFQLPHDFKLTDNRILFMNGTSMYLIANIFQQFHEAQMEIYSCYRAQSAGGGHLEEAGRFVCTLQIYNGYTSQLYPIANIFEQFEHARIDIYGRYRARRRLGCQPVDLEKAGCFVCTWQIHNR